MHCFFRNYTQLLQFSTSVQQNVILFAGLLLLLLSIVYILFVVLARQRQNSLLSRQHKMKDEFNRQLLQSQIETQEETFSVLSKELHDNVGQLLNSSKLFIGIAKRKPSAPVDILNMATESLSKAIHEIRSLSKVLDKEWLQQFNFIENLQTEINRLNVTDELIVRFTPVTRLLLDNDEQIILFRIVQESLQNAIKHARAQNIDVILCQENTDLIVTVSDDGAGFEEGVIPNNGVGFINMRHRAGLLGGTIAWQSIHGKGTSVKIQIPVKPDLA